MAYIRLIKEIKKKKRGGLYSSMYLIIGVHLEDVITTFYSL